MKNELVKYSFRNGEKYISLGQEVVVLNVNYGISFAKIKKIGTKKIYLDNGLKFYMNGSQDCIYCHDCLYSSERAYLDEKMKINLAQQIKDHNFKSMTLEQLIQIKELLK